MTNKYMAVHHDGNVTSFTPTATIEAAHAHLKKMINNRQGNINHTVSIVELYDDRVLYYKNTNNSWSDLLGLNGLGHTAWQFITQSIYQLLNRLTPAFTSRQ